MAKIVSVYREDQQCTIGKRQLPLIVDETLTMVLQLNTNGMQYDEISSPSAVLEVARFTEQYNKLTDGEVALALIVQSKELFNLLSQTVPCVGCRRSVERLFLQLSDSGHPALEPLTVTPKGLLALSPEFQIHQRNLFPLFYLYGQQLSEVVKAIPKSKKNRRCVLHSLDSQRTRPLGNWIELWDLMANECKDEVVLIESDTLSDTLEAYLRKHRFCLECRSKVFRAYNILIGEIDGSHEKGYLSSLYQGIRCCPPDKHIHIQGGSDYIKQLVQKAEPELLGSSSRRERHAKTMEVAQEEVLTCVGICLYARLHRIQQRLKEEEQTWYILFCLGVEALRKKFQVAVEEKVGVSQLELFCQELSKEQQREQQMREKKRQKKKKKKENKENESVAVEKESNCKCDSAHSSPCENRRMENCSRSGSGPKQGLQLKPKHVLESTCCGKRRCEESHLERVPPNICDSTASCSGKEKKKLNKKKGKQREKQKTVYDAESSETCGSSVCDCCSSSCRSTPEKECGSRQMKRMSCHNPSCGIQDAGYASGNCNDSNGNSSREGSDIACSEGFCNHEGECGSELESCSPIMYQCCQGSKHQNEQASNQGANFTLSLEEMLEESCSQDGEEEESLIPDDDIRAFQAEMSSVNIPQKRIELRETLRQKFQQMCSNNGPKPF